MLDATKWWLLNTKAQNYYKAAYQEWVSNHYTSSRSREGGRKQPDCLLWSWHWVLQGWKWFCLRPSERSEVGMHVWIHKKRQKLMEKVWGGGASLILFLHLTWYSQFPWAEARFWQRGFNAPDMPLPLHEACNWQHAVKSCLFPSLYPDLIIKSTFVGVYRCAVIISLLKQFSGWCNITIYRLSERAYSDSRTPDSSEGRCQPTEKGLLVTVNYISATHWLIYITVVNKVYIPELGN